MKTTISLLFSLTLILSSAVNAQTRDVKFMIDHSLDSFNFVQFQEFDLWDGSRANIENMMYYIHDLKMITATGDTIGNDDEHYFIDATEQETDFGSWDADSVVKVIFQWGVSYDKNHADPSQYNPNHPLAPKSPTMHWGWTSGYRFLRADGKFDDNGDGTPNLIFQYHMVGDNFVKEIEVDAKSMINQDDELEVWITAYYERMLSEVNLSANPSVHGSTTPIPMIWLNLTAEPVFDVFDGLMDAPVDTTDTSGTGIADVRLSSIRLAPNPALNGQINVEVLETSNEAIALTVFDLNGRMVKQPLRISCQRTSAYLWITFRTLCCQSNRRAKWQCFDPALRGDSINRFSCDFLLA